ncbi:MAG: hypothetical protein GX259_10330 [Bacteroidales bacterium]|nr:hypothetical protein [Bacteroidales bacterium]
MANFFASTLILQVLFFCTVNEGKHEQIIYDNTINYSKNKGGYNNSVSLIISFPIKKQVFSDLPKITIELTKNNEILLNKVIASKEIMIKELRSFLLKHGTNHYIKFVTHKKTSYSFYCEVQTCIFNVYTDLLNEKAIEIYNKSYEELNNIEKNKIDLFYPKNIGE